MVCNTAAENGRAENPEPESPMSFVAVHSAVRDSSTLHRAGCPRVATRRTSEVHEHLDYVFLDGAVEEVNSRLAETGRTRVKICACAKEAR